MERAVDALAVTDAMVPQEPPPAESEQVTEQPSQVQLPSPVCGPRPVIQPQKMPIVQLPVVQVASHQPIIQAPIVRPLVQPASIQPYLQAPALQPVVTPQSQFQFLPIPSTQQVICSPKPILSTGHILQVPGQSILPGQLVTNQLPIVSMNHQYSVLKQGSDVVTSSHSASEGASLVASHSIQTVQSQPMLILPSPSVQPILQFQPVSSSQQSPVMQTLIGGVNSPTQRVVRLPMIVPGSINQLPRPQIIRPAGVRFITTSNIVSSVQTKFVTTQPKIIGSNPVQIIPPKGRKSIMLSNLKNPSSPPVKKVVTLNQQQLMDVSTRAKKNPSPKLQSGIIQFSNPNGGNGQKIKVDISQSICPLTNNQAFLRNENISRKLELPDMEPGECAQNETFKDEEAKKNEALKKNEEVAEDDKEEDAEVSLECNERIGDSPEAEKKPNVRVNVSIIGGKVHSDDLIRNPLRVAKPIEQSILKDVIRERGSVKKEALDDLLQPLADEEAMEDVKPSISLTLNEFGLVEIPKLEKEESLKKEHIPPSPRKDNLSARKIQDDDILCCEGCGCYGMAGEFAAQNSCSTSCNRTILERVRDKQRKERDAMRLKMRREEKKSPLLKNLKKNSGQDEKEMVMSPMAIPKPSHYNDNYPWHDAKKGFVWSKYFEWSKSKAAPSRLFVGDPFPEQHKFAKGMKLEAIDQQHQSLICVVSVIEVQGPRLRLHFDGYGDSYDFWENADSENLFPAGWCSRNKQRLVPPKGYTPNNFAWDSYLSVTDAETAPEDIFLGRAQASVGADSTVHGWKTGMKLEAVDINEPELIYVATVANVMEGRILIHFDGWSMNDDYWTSPAAPYVHPVGWCSANKKSVIPPQGSNLTGSEFSWPSYLSATAARAVPSWAFRSPGSSRETTEFKQGMRLEAVDHHNTGLVRVASVADTKGRQIKIHYDGWPDEFDVWVDDQNRNIHPCGWSSKVGHPLESPLTPEEVKYWAERGGCPTPGCRGVGHVKGARYTSHHSVSACPYAQKNIDGEDSLPDRLQGSDRERIKENKTKSEVKIENMDDMSMAPMGRGNRRRRRRKFFDDESGKRKRELDESLLDDGESVVKMERRDSNASSKNGHERSDSSASGSIDNGGSKKSSDEKEIKKEVENIKSEIINPSEPIDNIPPRTEIETQTDFDQVLNTFETEWEDNIRKTVFQPGYLPQPLPVGALPFNWAEHSKILLGSRANSSKLNSKRAKLWSTSQVCDFIAEVPNIDHDSVTSKMREEEIDGESLLSLTQSDITSILEVKLGPAIKIFNAITAVRLRKE